MFQPEAPFYLPRIISEGGQVPELGLEVPSLRQISLPDLTETDLEEPLTGACGLNLCDGGGRFASTGATLTGLDSVSPGADRIVFLKADDSQLSLSLTFAAPVINGNLLLSQACKRLKGGEPIGRKDFAGSYTLASTAMTITLPVSLRMAGGRLDASIGPIETVFANERPFTLKLNLPGTPSRLTLDWEHKVNKPALVQDQLRRAVVQGMAARSVSGWLESYLNPLLAWF
ncbi:MAG: hypothetical protein ACOY94_20585 [Bacillota bacterium]